MTNAIEVRGLCKEYGDFRLDRVDLTVPCGAIVGLIGENGAGKSTTLRAILNLIRRTLRRTSAWCWTRAASTTR